MKKGERIINYIPVVLVVVMVLVLSLVMHWQGDAVAFSFFIPAENEDFSFIPLRDISDIWPSMCNHWHNSTGRFFTHAIVQLFCAFIGKTGFAICNALVWGGLIMLLLKMSGQKRLTFGMTAYASLLTFILYFPLSDLNEQTFPFEPPHQINYVWMGLWNMLWVYLFLKDKRNRAGLPGLILPALFSFLGGQANESFSIPIGGAILAYASASRFRISLRRYVMAICYGAGTLLVILAPGNFQRMGHSAWSLLHTAEGLFPGMLIPVIWVLSELMSRKPSRQNGYNKRGYALFFGVAIGLNYLLGIVLGMESGTRMLTCAGLLLIVLTLNNMQDVRYNAFLTAIVFLMIPAIGIYRYENMAKLNEKNILIERLYHESEDGVVVLPDESFLYNVREFVVRPHPYMMLERSKNPLKANIAIRPRSMMNLNLAADTNVLMPLSDQAWLMIRSRRHPAEFVIEKTLLPGVLNRPMPPRLMDWQDGYAVFDSTDMWHAAVYINERGYLNSRIKMYGPEK